MDPAQRIVSLVPSLTEAIFDLGAGHRLAGVTDYCTSPPAPAAGIRRVGGPRTPSRERIAELAPDLVIAGREESRGEDLEWIDNRFPLAVFECRSFEDALGVVERLGELLGAASAAAEAVQRMRSARGEVSAATRGRTTRVFYPIWTDPWMTVSKGTFVAEMLGAVGLRSVFADRPEPYPITTLSEAQRREPELILLPDEPHEFRTEDREIFRGFAAYRAGAVRCIPGRWAAWYGTRMDEGLYGLRSVTAECLPER